MNTNDQQADSFFDPVLDGDAGQIDNDAYGRDPQQQQDEPGRSTGNDDDRQHDPDRTNSDAGNDGGDTPASNAADANEDEDFYWDGERLDSPTSEVTPQSNDSDLVKQLRSVIKDQRDQLRDKNLRLPEPSQANAAPATSLPPRPRLEDEDVNWDEDVLAEKMESWYQAKANHDAQQKTVQQQQEALQNTFNERKEAYKQRIAKGTLRGYEAAETQVAGALPAEIQSALILYAERPEHVVMALSRNPDLLERAQKITDPVSLGMLIGEIQTRAQKKLPATKRDTVTSAPSDPRGRSNGPVRDMEAARERARKTGDYTEVHKLNAAAKARKNK